MASRVLRTGLLAGVVAGIVAFLLRISLVAPVALASIMAEDGVEARTTLTDWLPTLLGDIGAAMGYGVILAGIFSIFGRRVNLAGGALFGLAGYVCIWLLPAMIWTPELPGAGTDGSTPDLAADFVLASAFMHLARWIALGLVSAWLFDYFGPTPPRGSTLDITA